MNKNSVWKSIPIESNDGFTDKDLNDLVAIEELDEYSVQNESNVRLSGKTKTKNKKKKRLKNKKSLKNVNQMNDLNEDSEEEILERKIPKSMHLWESLNVEPPILKALEELSFMSPTPIQSKAIKAGLEDRSDILGAAETGSGKTLAFGIPLITHIMNDKNVDKSCKLRALVLTPTRELAIQVKKHLEAVSKYCELSIGVIVGGMAVQKQETCQTFSVFS